MTETELPVDQPPKTNGRKSPAKTTAGRKATTEEPIEKQLWKAADKLRKNIDAAEYKHIVLGLVFLKYISDAFVELYDKLNAEESAGADPKDKDEYKAENVFFVPPGARWSFLQGRAAHYLIHRRSNLDDAKRRGILGSKARPFDHRMPRHAAGLGLVRSPNPFN